MGKAALTEMCEAFCDTLEKAGYFAGVYASTYWFTSKLDHARLAGKYTIWLADYRAGYNKTLKRDIHQYTSNGHVEGISGRVDRNTCTLDFPGIIKKAGLNGFGKTVTAPTLRDITIKQASAGDINDFKVMAERKELKYEIK